MKNSSKIQTLLLSATLTILAGCSTGGSNGTSTSGTVSTSAAGSVYVNNQTPNSGSQTPQIIGYSANSSSSASASTVVGPTNDVFIGLASDASGNLYTVDKSSANGSYSVNEYAAGTNSSGSASTTAHTFTSTAISAAPVGIKVDASGNIYVMLTGGTVLRFAANSSGAVAPSATLTGVAGAMATDSNGNLYATVPVSGTDNHSAIAVYSSGYVTAALPSRTILPATEMTITSLAVDASGNIYATGKDVNGNVEVAVFAAAATGSSAAMRTISGASTNFVNPWGVQVDGAGNVYVGDSTTGATGSTVTVAEFAASASGNAAPAQKVSTTATYASTTALAVH